MKEEYATTRTRRDVVCFCLHLIVSSSSSNFSVYLLWMDKGMPKGWPYNVEGERSEIENERPEHASQQKTSFSCRVCPILPSVYLKPHCREAISVAQDKANYYAFHPIVLRFLSATHVSAWSCRRNGERPHRDPR